MKKKAADKIIMRDALRSQMVKREKYVKQQKDQDRQFDNMILENNDKLIEKYRQKKLDEHVKEIEHWSSQLKLSKSLKNMKQPYE